MAVTQQLVRMSEERLSRCQSSADELDRLVSLELEQDDGHLDVNWAPVGLVRAVSYVLGVSAAKDLEALFEGAEGVNAKHPSGVDGYLVYSPIKSTPAATVRRIYRRLRSASPQELGIAAEESVSGDGPASAWFQMQFVELLAFLDAACSRSQCVVAWWD